MMIDLECSDIEDCGSCEKSFDLKDDTKHNENNNNNNEGEKENQEKKIVNDNDVYDGGEEEDDDDGIQIIISKEPYKMTTIEDECNVDLEIKNEIDALVESSIDINGPCITILFANQLILVPVTAKISNRLASILWSLEKDYIESTFPHIELYNKLLKTAYTKNGGNGNKDDGLFAYLATKYERKTLNRTIHKNQNSQYQQQIQQQQQQQNNNDFKDCYSGLYRYTDFAIFIIKNGIIIDYAVHGYVSSINGILEKHKPKNIYYNAKTNDALDVFLKYPYQPFYTTMKDRLVPIQIHKLNNDQFNPLAFCIRHDVFCASCIGVRDLRNFLIYRSVEFNNTDDDSNTKKNDLNSKRISKRLDMTKLSCLEDFNHLSANKLNSIIRTITKQPENNAEKLRIQKAAKRLGRFGRKLKASTDINRVTSNITKLICFGEKLEREKMKRNHKQNSLLEIATSSNRYYNRQYRHRQQHPHNYHHHHHHHHNHNHHYNRHIQQQTRHRCYNLEGRHNKYINHNQSQYYRRSIQQQQQQYYHQHNRNHDRNNNRYNYNR